MHLLSFHAKTQREFSQLLNFAASLCYSFYPFAFGLLPTATGSATSEAATSEATKASTKTASGATS